MPILVAGRTYYQPQLEGLSEGEHIATLLPEPTNEYDANAIMVLVDDVKIGYVPRKIAAYAHQQVPPDGLQVPCVIHAPTEDRHVWLAYLHCEFYQ
jgi:hypothetical protein